jgi:lysophospholipase L1-like esterase
VILPRLSPIVTKRIYGDVQPFGQIAQERLRHDLIARAAHAVPRMEYILCVGDSLTFGARDEFHRSYPAELSRLFHEREGRFVYCVNHGISGETSSQLLRRIYANARSCPQAALALLVIGTNDTMLPQPVGIYRDNIRQIIGVLREDREWVGVGLLPPVVGPGLPNYPRNGGVQV